MENLFRKSEADMSLYQTQTKLPDNTVPIKMKNTSPWRILVQNFLFCTLIALFLWQLVPAIGQHGFLVNFTHSQAIGTSITLLGIASNVLTARAGYSTPSIKMLIMIVVTPIGIILGLWIAGALLGLPHSPLEFLQQQDQLLITALVAILASAAFNWHLSRRSKMSQLELQAAEERHRADNARHAMLRAQLDPHMLFNTLANLRALIEIDKQRAIEMLDHLDNFLRATLKSSQENTHSLRQEFNILEDYLELMKIRLASRLSYTLNLPSEQAGIKVPALLLQPVVENAIRHGIEPQIEGGDVQVSAHISNHQLVLQVINTGAGIDLQAPRLNTESSGSDAGFGLSSLLERLNQFYNGSAEISVAPLEHTVGGSGTNVTLKIPVTEITHG